MSGQSSAGPTYTKAAHGFTQDMPPKGGYANVPYKRNLPVRGVSGAVIMGTTALICSYGFYKMGQANIEKRELEREKKWSRIWLLPLLQAEMDRDIYRREQAALAREKIIMSDVPGWEAGKSVYNTQRYVPKQIVVM
ncbi:GRIM-19 protein [Kockovaella imperatae]|uniref:NADH dehydrogenase [ubiquinone] 1 alpha subcomplex subunit 13 n=1 Tax=Kockovaella imperatae TaxID=4999 RepID=A0A1Y1UJ89_9TREE|nr:GRIM-19 protein [Kockovaella imperatae]ORX37617.1 GRIM-19 protein [Kockovaella imperatae]